ncbi:origin recognition complex subunit 2-domain-containing protein, partial [Chiua virens]
MDSDSDVSDNDQTHFNDANADPGHTRTAFDAYFVHAASRTRTSANVFSAHVLPLTQEEYNDAIAAYDARTVVAQPRTRWFGPHDARTAYRRYAHELDQGFNLVFYGFGSKRVVLNDFASQELARRGSVVIVNGYHPNTTLKDVLASIERVPSVTDYCCQRRGRTITTHMFLLLRRRRATHLARLFSGPPPSSSPGRSLPGDAAASHSEDTHTTSPKRGYAFIWHDLTTLLRYDTELSFADRSSISGASYASTGARSALATTPAVGTSTPLTETAVTHVLAAVTSKAKKLFVLLGTKQLANVEAASGAAAGADAQPTTDMAQFGLDYDALFSLARENFVATSDTALRALLGEFKDHGLILAGIAGGGSGSGDSLWIPLRKERLVRVLKSIETESP